jgi:hypothetical protein
MTQSFGDIDKLSPDLAPSELEIVDTFTKLIFGSLADLSPTEQAIIQVMRSVDVNFSLDRTEDMGVYLRALGVKEMIKLVTQVHLAYLSQAPALFLASQHPRAQF